MKLRNAQLLARVQYDLLLLGGTVADVRAEEPDAEAELLLQEAMAALRDAYNRIGDVFSDARERV